jgi:hypothetical protein
MEEVVVAKPAVTVAAGVAAAVLLAVVMVRSGRNTGKVRRKGHFRSAEGLT